MNPMVTERRVAQSITYHFNVASYLYFMFGCWRGTLLYLLKIRSRLPRLAGTTFSGSRFTILLWRWFVRVRCTTTTRSRVGRPWRTAIKLSKVSECPTQMRVIWISHILQFCLQFHENVCLCIMKESSGKWKKNGFLTILVLSVLYATISSIVAFSFLSHWSNRIKKNPESKTTDGTLWNTLYMIHCSRKVSVEYNRNEKQRKTSFAE